MKNSLFTPQKALVLLLSISALLHILVAVSLNLTVDGAHYALYGAHLDWSYYDHPPLIGWLQSLPLLFSDSDLAMCFWAIFFNAATSVVLYRFVQILFSDGSVWLAWLTVLFAQSMLVLNLLGVTFSPQDLLLFFGLLVVFQTYRIVVVGKQSFAQFLFLGILLGLAGLSEYTAIFLAIGLFIFIYLENKKLLFTFKFWGAVSIALLLCAPILYWNIAHQWISFRYQSNHIFTHARWSPHTFWQSELIQFVAYNPGLYILAILTLIQSWRQRHTPPVKLMLAFVMPMFIAFLYSHGVTLGLPHWTALSWLLLMPFIAHHVWCSWQRNIIKLLTYFSFFYAFIMFALIYSQVFFHWIAFPLGSDPYLDLYGWKEAAQAAKQEVLLIQRDEPGTHPLIFVPHWSLASHIGWYAHYPIQIAQYRSFSQYDLWYGRPNENSVGIMVLPSGWQNDFHPGTKVGQFRNCLYLKTIDYSIRQHLIDQFKLYRCWHYNTGNNAGNIPNVLQNAKIMA